MLYEPNEVAADALEASLLDNAELNDSSDEQPPELHAGLSSQKRYLRTTYGRRPMRLLDRYFRSVFELEEWSRNLIFLARCRSFEIIPRDSRVECRVQPYNRKIARIQDECSYRLMLDYLDYSRLRKEKLRRSFLYLYEKLENVLSLRDLSRVADLAEVKYAKLFDDAVEFKSGVIADLLEEYGFEQN